MHHDALCNGGEKGWEGIFAVSRRINREILTLTDAKIARLSRPGLLAVGSNLYVNVTGTGTMVGAGIWGSDRPSSLLSATRVRWRSSAASCSPKAVIRSSGAESIASRS